MPDTEVKSCESDRTPEERPEQPSHEPSNLQEPEVRPLTTASLWQPVVRLRWDLRSTIREMVVWHSCIFLTTVDGGAYMAADGLFGLDKTSYRVPRPLSVLRGRRVVSAAFGQWKSNPFLVLVTNDGKVFGCGDNEHNQLGVSCGRSRSGLEEITECANVLASVGTATPGAHPGEDELRSQAGPNHTVTESPGTQPAVDHGREDNRLAGGTESRGQVSGQDTVFSRELPSENQVQDDGILTESTRSNCLAERGLRQVVAGGAFCLVRTSNGEVWGWGDNRFGQVGNTSVGSRVNQPVQLYTPSDFLEEAVHISCGQRSSLLVTRCGKVYTWGRNDDGELGLGHTAHVSEPSLIPSTQNRRVSSQVFCGRNHTISLTMEGQCYIWGWNQRGRLGFGDENNRNHPTKLGRSQRGVAAWLFTNNREPRFVQVMASGLQSAACDEHGVIYKWGVFGDYSVKTPKQTNHLHILDVFSHGDTARTSALVRPDPASLIAVLRDLHEHQLENDTLFSNIRQQTGLNIAAINDLRLQISTEREQTTNIGSLAIPAIRQQADDSAAAIINLEEQSRTNAAEITSLSRQLSASQQAVISLQGQMETVDNGLGSLLLTTIPTVQRGQSSIQERVDQLEDRLSQCHQQRGEVAGQVAQFGAEFSTYQENADRFAEDIGRRTGTNANEITTLKHQVSASAHEINNLSGKLERLDTKFSEATHLTLMGRVLQRLDDQDQTIRHLQEEAQATKRTENLFLEKINALEDKLNRERNVRKTSQKDFDQSFKSLQKIEARLQGFESELSEISPNFTEMRASVTDLLRMAGELREQNTQNNAKMKTMDFKVDKIDDFERDMIKLQSDANHQADRITDMWNNFDVFRVSVSDSAARAAEEELNRRLVEGRAQARLEHEARLNILQEFYRTGQLGPAPDVPVPPDDPLHPFTDIL